MSALEQPNTFEGSAVEARLIELGRLYRLAKENGWRTQEDDEEELAVVRARWKKLKDRYEAIEADRAKAAGVEE